MQAADGSIQLLPLEAEEQPGQPTSPSAPPNPLLGGGEEGEGGRGGVDRATVPSTPPNPQLAGGEESEEGRGGGDDHPTPPSSSRHPQLAGGEVEEGVGGGINDQPTPPSTSLELQPAGGEVGRVVERGRDAEGGVSEAWLGRRVRLKLSQGARDAVGSVRHRCLCNSISRFLTRRAGCDVLVLLSSLVKFGAVSSSLQLRVVVRLKSSALDVGQIRISVG